MRLQLDILDINDIKFGPQTCVKNHILYINKKEAEAHLLEDPKLADVCIDLTFPGEMTRVLNIQDVVEPRCKVTPEGSDFPGYVSKIQTAGSGVTRALRGIAVVLCNPDTKRTPHFYFDMAGQLGKVCKFAKMPLVIITVRKPKDVLYEDFDFAIHAAQFRLAVYLAKAGHGEPVDEVKIYEHDFSSLPRKSESDLPRIAYFDQMYTPQYDHKGKSEPFFYGEEVRHILPTIMHPNEILDGGIVAFFPTKSLTTYDKQNHAMINELYARHMKELIFCGMVVAVAHMNPIHRERRAMISANLLKDILQADGVVMTKIHGGMVHMDLACTAEACERLGIVTVPQHQGVVTFGTLAENAFFKSDLLKSISYVGNTIEVFPLRFKAERFLGGTADTVIFSPDHKRILAKDEVIIAEEFLIPGIHDHTGGSKIITYDY